MPTSPLEFTRAQIIAFRRRAGALDERLPRGSRSPTSSCVRDRGIFTLGRLPEAPHRRRRAEDMAARVHAHLAGRRLPDNDVQKALGVGNTIKYATTTGTVLIRWDGARSPLVWAVPRPEIEPHEAHHELARRYLHVSGPATPAWFAMWAGIAEAEALAAFDALSRSLTAVRTPLGDAWILARDEHGFREPPGAPAAARLLPSGDAYFLLWRAGRELLVPDAAQRGELWTSRVWPGAVLVAGEIAGTWRRAQADLSVRSWRRLTSAERPAVEAEARSLPLPGIEGTSPSAGRADVEASASPRRSTLATCSRRTARTSASSTSSETISASSGGHSSPSPSSWC